MLLDVGSKAKPSLQGLSSTSDFFPGGGGGFGGVPAGGSLASAGFGGVPAGSGYGGSLASAGFGGVPAGGGLGRMPAGAQSIAGPYKDPTTGASLDYPLAGVPPEQQYGTTAAKQAQAEAEAAQAALSRQQAGQGLTAQTQSEQAASAMATQQAASAAALQAQRAAEAQQASERGFNQASSFLSATPQSQYGAGGPSGPSLEDAQAAAFARAKDTAGALARASLTALRESAASRGTLGAGFEGVSEAQNAIAPAMNTLGNLNASQLSDAYAAAQHRADMQQQGQIAQRGQNLGMAQSIMGLNRLY